MSKRSAAAARKTIRSGSEVIREETKDIKRKLWSKSPELNVLLAKTNPDLNQVKAVCKEISELRDALDEKNINYEIEIRKIAPENGFSGDYGERQPFGMGYGRHMDGYEDRMGYGPGHDLKPPTLVLSSLDVLGSWGRYALLLICPLGHLLMMRGMTHPDPGSAPARP
jgi:hypothetical protein